jgi:hypothetical protein
MIIGRGMVIAAGSCSAIIGILDYRPPLPLRSTPLLWSYLPNHACRGCLIRYNAAFTGSLSQSQLSQRKIAMKPRTVANIIVIAVLLGATQFSGTALAQQTRKIRIKNNSDTGIRIKCLGYSEGVGFLMDVPQGQQRTQDGVVEGSRGIIVWENFNEKVIITEKFTLSGMNLIGIVLGDSTNGYRIAFELTAGDLE